MKRAACLLLTLILTGCATVSVPTRLRSQDDLRPAGGTAKAYALPESAVTTERSAWGHLAADSLVLYRPISGAKGPPTYRRHVRDVGSSGIDVAGYTLADGRHVRLDGTVRRKGDQLEFVARPGHMEKDAAPVVLAVSDVQSIDVRVPDPGTSTVMWGFLLVTVATAVALSFASAMEESTM